MMSDFISMKIIFTYYEFFALFVFYFISFHFILFHDQQDNHKDRRNHVDHEIMYKHIIIVNKCTYNCFTLIRDFSLK
jgi:hypothetical protein